VLPAVLIFKERIPLSVSATVEAATTMEAAGASELTSAANRAASSVTARHYAAVRVAYARVRVATATPTLVTPATATPEFGRMTPVVPRAGADEDASDKVIAAIEAVGRASVRIVIIVSVSARRRSCGDIAWSDSDPYSHSNLRL
jgi:hypothetical protein